MLHLIPVAQEDVTMRHQVGRINARVEAALGDAEEARAAVIGLVEEARAAGYVLLELEDRIVLGEIELAAGDVAAGRAELAGVARRARELGACVIAHRV